MAIGCSLRYCGGYGDILPENFLFEMVSMGAFSVALCDLIIIILISDSTGTSDQRPANQPMAVIADLNSHFPEF